MSRRYLAFLIGGAILGAVLLILAANVLSAGAATPTMDGRRWLAAQPELTTQLANHGTWQWVICGTTQPGSPNPCPAGDAAAYGSYWKLRYAISHPAGRRVFFLDQEGWTYTPRYEQQHQYRYLRLAALYARAHHVTLIEAPVPIGYATPAARRAGMAKVDAWAARWAPVVDIQNQAAAANPAQYKAEAIQFTKAIRAAARTAHHSVTILDNLSTDPGGHLVGGPTATPGQSAAILHASYEAARPYVDGFWLETPTWTSHPPAPDNCGNTGCPAVALAFLTMIGAPS